MHTYTYIHALVWWLLSTWPWVGWLCLESWLRLAHKFKLRISRNPRQLRLGEWYCHNCVSRSKPWVLWCCWLGGRKGIRPVKTEWWGADAVICLECGADLHTAQLMPLPLTDSCFSKIQVGFTFLVPAHPDISEKRPLTGCVCVSRSAADHWKAVRLAFKLFSYALTEFCLNV